MSRPRLWLTQVEPSVEDGGRSLVLLGSLLARCLHWGALRFLILSIVILSSKLSKLLKNGVCPWPPAIRWREQAAGGEAGPAWDQQPDHCDAHLQVSASAGVIQCLICKWLTSESLSIIIRPARSGGGGVPDAPGAAGGPLRQARTRWAWPELERSD